MVYLSVVTNGGMRYDGLSGGVVEKRETQQKRKGGVMARVILN